MTLSRLRSNNDNALFPCDLYFIASLRFVRELRPEQILPKPGPKTKAVRQNGRGSTGYALPARYTFLAMPGRDKTTGSRSTQSATAFGHLRKQGETDGLASVLITPTASPGCGKLRNPGFGNGTQKNRSPVPRAPQKHRNRNKGKAIPPPGLPSRRKSRHTLPHTDVRGATDSYRFRTRVTDRLSGSAPTRNNIHPKIVAGRFPPRFRIAIASGNDVAGERECVFRDMDSGPS